MNNQICFKIDGMPLYVDEYLVDFDIPIFYICKNNHREKFSVICVNSHTLEYLISDTTNEDILKMLESKLLLTDFVLKSKRSWHVISGDSIETDRVEQLSRIPDEFLPKKNEYLDLSNARIKNYQRRIRQEIIGTDEFSLYSQAFDTYYTDIAAHTFVSFLDYSKSIQAITIPAKKSSLSKNYFSHALNFKTKRRIISCR